MKLSYTFPLVASVSSQDGLTKISMNTGSEFELAKVPERPFPDAAVITGAAMLSFAPPCRSIPRPPFA